jgi:hypothetical protein
MIQLNNNCIEIVSFTLPKIKENPEDIQDAVYFSEDRTMAAIADGASSSLYPRRWADILVKKFCEDSGNSIQEICKNWQQWLKPLQAEWFEYYQAIQQDATVDWYRKATQHKNFGSSTFVGLKLYTPDSSGKTYWECLAIGDSCLFQIKANSQEIISFPKTRSEDFSSVTDAVHSLSQYQSNPPQLLNGFYGKNDIFLLATDALAEWILKDLESQGNRWEKLVRLSDKNEFFKLIENLRSDKLIKNDDTTFLRLKVMSIPQKKIQNALPPGNNQGYDFSKNAGVVSDKRPVEKNKNPTDQSLKKLRICVILSTALILSFSGLNLFTNLVNTTNLRKVSQNNDLNRILIPVYDNDKNKNKTQPVGFVWRKIINDQNILLYNDLDYQFLVELPTSVDRPTDPKWIDSQQKTLTIPKSHPPVILYIKTKDVQKNQQVGYLLPGTYKYSQSEAEASSSLIEIQIELGE